MEDKISYSYIKSDKWYFAYSILTTKGELLGDVIGVIGKKNEIEQETIDYGLKSVKELAQNTLKKYYEGGQNGISKS